MLPIAVQLYSLRAQAEKDFAGVLRQVAAMGYAGVEPAGFWNLRPTVFRNMAQDLGLQIVGTHAPWCRPSSLGEAMEVADLLGVTRLACGYGPADFATLADIQRTADEVNGMLEVLGRNGYTLYQHNHYWEFQRLDGRLKYEIFVDLCPGLQLELDCFWSANFGLEDAVAMLRRFADRCLLLHMKDGRLPTPEQARAAGDRLYAEKANLVPLGSGDLPIRALLAAAPASVQAVIVELDYCEMEMSAAIRQSFDFLLGTGLCRGRV